MQQHSSQESNWHQHPTVMLPCHSKSNRNKTKFYCAPSVRLIAQIGWLDKIDQTEFLDQTYYLICKLSDQTEVRTRTRIRPDSKTYHDQHVTFVYKWQTTTLIYDNVSYMIKLLMSGAKVFRRVFVPKDNILNILCECLCFCDQKKNRVILLRD